MSRSEEPQGFWGVIVGFFRFLFILILVLLIIAAIGAGLYYGVPWVYQNVIDPINSNSARLAALEQQVETLRTQHAEEQSDMQAQMAQLEADLMAAQEEIAAQGEQLDALKTRIQRCEQRITRLETSLAADEEAISAIAEEIRQVQDQLGAETAALQEAQQQLQGRFALLQSAEDLLHVRILLLEDNPRGARDALTAAEAHLQEAASQVPAWSEAIEGFTGEVQTIDGLIAEHSFRTLSDLEALWAEITDFAMEPPATLAGSGNEQPISPLPTPTPPAP